MSDECKPHVMKLFRTKCPNAPREPHTCPYLHEVHEGEPGCDRLCNCCDACTRECAEDV